MLDCHYRVDAFQVFAKRAMLDDLQLVALVAQDQVKLAHRFARIPNRTWVGIGAQQYAAAGIGWFVPDVHQDADQAMAELTIPADKLETVIAWLDTLLKDENLDVYQAAAYAMAKLTIPADQVETVIAWLDTLLEDENPDVRRAAAKARNQLAISEDKLITTFKNLESTLRNEAPLRKKIAQSFIASAPIRLLTPLFIYLETEKNLAVKNQNKIFYLQCCIDVQKRFDDCKEIAIATKRLFNTINDKNLPEEEQEKISEVLYEHLISSLLSNAKRHVAFDEKAEKACMLLNNFFLRNGAVGQNALILSKFINIPSDYARSAIGILWSWVLQPHQPNEEKEIYLERLALRVIHHYLMGNKVGKLSSIARLMRTQQENIPADQKTPKLFLNKEVFKEYVARNTSQYMHALCRIYKQKLAMNIDKKDNGISKVHFSFLHHTITSLSSKNPDPIIKKTVKEALEYCTKQKKLPELIQYLKEKGITAEKFDIVAPEEKTKEASGERLIF